MTETISVHGMTCENCVRHVRTALLELPGVRTAEVDLAAGSATIEAEPMPTRDEIAVALDEAGYTLA